MLTKIISGGQTGADIGALEAAKSCKIKTGGTAPYKYKTEEGFNESLKNYGLIDCAVSSYSHRTELNVKDSDGTVIFMLTESSGSKKTMQYCKEQKKPFILNPKSPEILLKWIEENEINILNIAGNRESKSNGIRKYVKKFISDTIIKIQETT